MKLSKSIFTLLFITILSVSCNKKAKETTTKVTTTEAKTITKTPPVGKVETATFHIKGMTCAVMCAAKIQDELTAMVGVQKATVDFDKETATVKYDSAVLTPEKLVKKTESVADGKTYKVSNVKTTATKTAM